MKYAPSWRCSECGYFNGPKANIKHGTSVMIQCTKCDAMNHVRLVEDMTTAKKTEDDTSNAYAMLNPRAQAVATMRAMKAAAPDLWSAISGMTCKAAIGKAWANHNRKAVDAEAYRMIMAEDKSIDSDTLYSCREFYLRSFIKGCMNTEEERTANDRIRIVQCQCLHCYCKEPSDIPSAVTCCKCGHTRQGHGGVHVDDGPRHRRFA